MTTPLLSLPRPIATLVAAATCFAATSSPPAYCAPSHPPAPFVESLHDPKIADPLALPLNVRELGRVRWVRDFEGAVRLAETTGRPLFLLFQEIPGCATCVLFGETVLDHPGLADLVESEFVPVVVRNNEPGPAAKILERFEEPAWNEPVVRFVDAKGVDLVARKDGVWTSGEIAERMIAALETAGRPVPEALRLFAGELDLPRLRRAAFAAARFDEGEADLAAIPGVVAVRASRPAGTDGAGAAVEVVYNSGATDEATLQSAAAALGYERIAAADLAPAPPAEHLRSLAGSPARLLPLTPAQASRANAALHAANDPAAFFTPRQQELQKLLAMALERDASALDGFVRPDDIADLPDYERRLVRRLEEMRGRGALAQRN